MTNGEIAEHLMKRRANALFVLAILFMVTQGAFIDSAVHNNGPGAVKIAAWVVMAIVLLIFFATGGGWNRSHDVRALMNDEGTQQNRARATTIAFYNMMATGVILYGIGLIKPVSGGQAVHLIMSVGIASALVSFATWERMALKAAR